ncbi:hypothetical protein [Sphingomonas sp. R86520]|uniref:hypothetical protein n=1 Tax=Sphingomonas sp. R86520 TaxID=3093859 RepID=UPI0036D298BA
MSFIGDAIGSVLGGITGANQSAKGAQAAAQTQATAADKAIAEQVAARGEARGLQQPFVNAGTASLTQQMALLGLNGTADQQTSISALLSSPQYTSGVQQGEEAILANASATGGLRGGNTQNSLSRFRADLLNTTIQNQMQNLNGLTSLGQNAAAGVGNNAMNSANNIGSLLNQQGAAIAGGQIAKGNVVANNYNTMLQAAGAIAGF